MGHSSKYSYPGQTSADTHCFGMCVSQRRFGLCGEAKISYPCWESNSVPTPSIKQPIGKEDGSTVQFGEPSHPVKLNALQNKLTPNVLNYQVAGHEMAPQRGRFPDDARNGTF
jgi:hypothetical protein